MLDMGRNNAGHEVHEHSYITGPNANICGRKLVHSHEGGDVPHKHEHTGPAARTIDKDEWYAATGLKGGGRKKFTKRPTGPQLPTIVVEPPTFEIIVVGAPNTAATGPGDAVPHRLRLAFGARVTRVTGPRKVA